MSNINSFRFFLRFTDGTPLAWIPPDSWIFFRYDRRVNDVGRCEGIMSYSVSDKFREFLNVENGEYLDAILEVWRRPKTNLNEATREFRLDQEYLIRYTREELLNDGRFRGTVIGRTPMHFLARSEIMAGNNGVSDLPPQGEEIDDFIGVPITKPSVPTWEGQSQTANDSSTSRKMAGAVRRSKTVSNTKSLASVSVPTDVAVGDFGLQTHRVAERYKTLLDFLQRASATSWYGWFYGLTTPTAVPIAEPVDFDVVPDSPRVAGQWVFTVYPNGRGRDLRKGNTAGNRPVIFSPKLNNTSQPVSVLDRLDERTRIIVGGAGQDENREILRVINSTNDAGSIWNRVDEYIDSRQIDNFPTGIEQAVNDAQWRVKEKGMRREYTFLPVPVDGTRYGADYDLGDLVTSYFQGKSDDYQIRQITITLTPSGSESIDIEFGQLDGSFRNKRDFRDQIVNLSGDLLRKITQLSTAE